MASGHELATRRSAQEFAMIIITGVRFAGKVDAVPRVGHVATRFFHLYYVPLIPLGTFFVNGERDDSLAGFPLPLDAKSIIVCWLRTAGWLGLIAAGVVTFIGAADHRPHRIAVGLGGAVLAALWLWLLYRLRFIVHASYERAIELARRIGLPAEQLLMLEVAYGRMNADQAERELVRRYEAAGPKTT
jgi:hypothetical protein